MSTHPPSLWPNDSGTWEVVVGSFVFTSIALVALVARLCTRVLLIGRFGWCDFVMIIAWVLDALMAINFIIGAHYGLGDHHLVWTPAIVPIIVKLDLVTFFLHPITLGLVKLSILLQYIEIFPSFSIRRLCWIFVFIVGAEIIISIFLGFFSVQPFSDFWHPERHPKILNFAAILMFYSTFNIFTDISLIILPISVVRKLQLRTRQKLSLYGIFVLAGAGCVASILRLQAIACSSADLGNTSYYANVLFCSAMETNLGIICACLATLKPLLVRFCPKVLESGSRPSNGPHDSLGLSMPASIVGCERGTGVGLSSIRIDEPIHTAPRGWFDTGGDIEMSDLYHDIMKTIDKNTEYIEER